MQNNLTQNIKKARQNSGLTQEQVSEKLNLSRQTYIEVENGKRELKSSELEKLSAIFHVPVAEFFDEPRNNDKFEQMYFYILDCYKKSGIGKTKLAKLLYLSDFRSFYDNLEPISGVRYIKREYGPVADIFFEFTDNAYEAGKISIDIQDDGKMLIKSLRHCPDFSLLSELERKSITEICKAWESKRTQEIVNFTHEQKPWMSCRDGEYIPYSLIIQEDPDHVYKPIAE